MRWLARLGALLAALAGSAQAQQPYNQLNQNYAVGGITVSGIPAAGQILVAIGPTAAAWDGTLNVTPGGPVTITPTVSSTNQGIVVNQTPSGSFGAGNLSFNPITITSDSVAISGLNFGIGFSVSQSYGGATMTGGREAIVGSSSLTSPSSPSNTLRDYVGVVGIANAFSSDNGTGGSPQGAFFGANFVANATSGSTNLFQLAGIEVDIQLKAGSSAAIRDGIAIVGASAVQGSSTDAALWLYNTTSTGWKDLILVGGGAQYPVDASGNILRSTAGSIANGIDVSAATISGSAFKSTGFSVDGSGNVMGVALSATSLVNSALYVGGGAVGSAIELRSTIAAGTTDYIKVTVGNNGATEAFRAVHSGGVCFACTSDPGLGMIYTNSAAFVIRSKASYTNNAGAQTATLTNGPTAGNPTKWIPIDDNGTTRNFPVW